MFFSLSHSRRRPELSLEHNALCFILSHTRRRSWFFPCSQRVMFYFTTHAPPGSLLPHVTFFSLSYTCAAARGSPTLATRHVFFFNIHAPQLEILPTLATRRALFYHSRVAARKPSPARPPYSIIKTHAPATQCPSPVSVSQPCVTLHFLRHTRPERVMLRFLSSPKSAPSMPPAPRRRIRRSALFHFWKLHSPGPKYIAPKSSNFSWCGMAFWAPFPALLIWPRLHLSAAFPQVVHNLFHRSVDNCG